MIRRVVRLTLKEDKADDFKAFVTPKVPLIKGFDGCEGLEFLQDTNESNVFYTISLWQSEEALNSYRASELFGTIWPNVKPWFKDKALTYSMNKLV